MKIGDAAMDQMLSECDREVLHRPGRIQPHGVLLLLDRENLVVQAVSENAAEWIGIEPEDLIGTSFLDRIASDTRSTMAVLFRESVPAHSNPLRVEIVNGADSIVCGGIAQPIGDQVILELEEFENAEVVNRVGERSLQHFFTLTSATLRDLSGAETPSDAADLVCQRLKDFTGFDRVMFYRFAEDLHGEVVAEAREPHLEPFLHLHYPAGDIPKNARDLYVRNPIRSIVDVSAETVGLVPADTELDMTHCALRAVSPVHIRYLKNMGVAASASISLVDGGELWGLLACHHYSGPLHLSYSRQVSCVHFGIVLSSQLRTMQRSFLERELADRQRMVARIVTSLSGAADIADAITGHADVLAELVSADGLVFRKNDEIREFGAVPDTEISRALSKHCERELRSEVFSTASLSESLPGLAGDPGAVSGVLALSCGRGWTLLFFRREHVHEVAWAGDPRSKASADPLTPRASFEKWTETVRGRSRPWTENDLKVAAELRSAIMAFVVQQSLHVESLNDELARKNEEIQQFAYSVSHDLKAPLVTINGWIGALAEDLEAGDQEGIAHSLDRIRLAVNRMGDLIEDLLDFSKIGKLPGEFQEVDMGAVLEELRIEFEERFAEKDATLRISDSLLPLYGYRSEIMRVFQNLIDNGLKYGLAENSRIVSVDCEDQGSAVRYWVEDQGMGIEKRYQKKIFELFQRADPTSRGTGVGLAAVEKITQIHRGKCGVESESGQGARFWVQFPKNPESE